ncbi:MAG: relaxase, partial [Bacteroidota bacterium]
HVLDEKGNKVGIPQKASSFFMKPTLSKLEKLFRENRSLKQSYRKKLTVAIDWQLLKKPTTVEQLVKALEKEHINMILHRGKSDIIFGVTYIDHRSKCVFNGSDLGKQYSAKGILQSCNYSSSQIPAPGNEKQHPQTEFILSPNYSTNEKPGEIEKIKELKMGSRQITSQDYIPFQWKKKRRRKRKKNI